MELARADRPSLYIKREIKTVLEDLSDCVTLWKMSVFHSDLKFSLNTASGTSVWRMKTEHMQT